MADWAYVARHLDLSIRPIGAGWSGPRLGGAERSPYSANIGDTIARLVLELKELRAKNAVLMIDFRENAFRIDGMPRADAKADSPAIILAFDCKFGPLRLSFDRWRRWEDNLRSIAMHLEHLRKASMYGVGRDGEQYRGWKQLAAPAAAGSRQEAAEWLVQIAGLDPESVKTLLASPEAVGTAYRAALHVVHPDRAGNSADFMKLKIVIHLLGYSPRREGTEVA